MTAPDLVIPGLTPDAFAALQAKAQAAGLPISGLAGSADVPARGHTVGISWSYSAEGQALNLVVTHKPMLWPLGDVVAELKQQIAAALPQEAS